MTLLILSLGLAESFVDNGARPKRPASLCWRRQAPDGKENDDEESKEQIPSSLSDQSRSERDNATFEERIDKFLDTEFFNPQDVKNGSPLKWFADLVKNDYATAEALYASFFIAGMVLMSQELVRMQIYGDKYVPFQRLGDGSLF